VGTVGLPPLATSNKKSRRGRNSHGPEWPSGQVAKWPSGRRLDFSKVRPRWPLGQPVPRRCNHGRDARATFMARRRQPTWLIRRRSPHNGDHVCLPTSCQPDGSLWKAGGGGRLRLYSVLHPLRPEDDSLRPNGRKFGRQCNHGRDARATAAIDFRPFGGCRGKRRPGGHHGPVGQVAKWTAP
jgi:hypothetical protein